MEQLPGLEDFLEQFLVRMEWADVFAALPSMAPQAPLSVHTWVDPTPGPVDWHADPVPDDDPFGHGDGGGDDGGASAGVHQWTPEDTSPPDYHAPVVDTGNPWHQTPAPSFDLLA